MTTPVAFDRSVLYLPGDCLARPHSNCYWLLPGRLLAGEHPGVVLGASVTATVDALLDAGVRQFIDLTEEHEPPLHYATALRERARARGIPAAHRRFAIPDCGVPSDALMRAILDAIHAAMDAREPVYVHCFAGVGRTGTVVGCLLREHGLSARDALEAISLKWRSMEKRVRYPTSPEWPDQFALIERWPSPQRVDTDGNVAIWPAPTSGIGHTQSVDNTGGGNGMDPASGRPTQRMTWKDSTTHES